MTNQKCKGTSHTKRPLVFLLSVELAASSNCRERKCCNHQSRGVEKGTYRAKEDARFGMGEFLKHGYSVLQKTREKSLTTPRWIPARQLGFPRLAPFPCAAPQEAQRGSAEEVDSSHLLARPGTHRAGLLGYVARLSKTMPPWAHPSEMANRKGREGHGTRVTEFTLNAISYRWARGVKTDQPFLQGSFLKTYFLKGEKLQSPSILTVGKLHVRQRKRVQAFRLPERNAGAGDPTLLWPRFCTQRDRVRGGSAPCYARCAHALITSWQKANVFSGR